jgi:hypothetical protein
MYTYMHTYIEREIERERKTLIYMVCALCFVDLNLLMAFAPASCPCCDMATLDPFGA